MIYPIKAEAWARMREVWERPLMAGLGPMMAYESPAPDMGLAPGGRMRQEIYEDDHSLSDWDQRHSSRCFVHLANSMVWRSITGREPPTVPPTAEEYTRAGLPWFDYYADGKAALDGTSPIKGLKSVATIGATKGDAPLPENASVDPERVVPLGSGRRADEVREGTF